MGRGSTDDMNPINFVRKAFAVDWKGMLPLVRQMAKESGRSRFDVLRDMTRCYREDGFTWKNYATFGFHLQRDPAMRRTFFSQTQMDNFSLQAHTAASKEILRDKGKFLRHFSDFIKRDFVDLRVDDFARFNSLLEKHPIIFVKPPLECGGKGVERFLSAEISDKKAFHQQLLDEGRYIVEEAIVQNSEMAKLSVNSINTLRVGSCRNPEGELSIPYVLLRISFTKAYNDNATTGGGFVLISDEGKIESQPATYLPLVQYFEKNPLTGFPYVGFEIPYFEEVKALVLAAHRLLPESRYIGWDVAISDKGPLLVEGNENPAADLFQQYRQLPGPEGAKAKMEKALGTKL